MPAYFNDQVTGRLGGMIELSVHELMPARGQLPMARVGVHVDAARLIAYPSRL
jgi:hypothetical protein